MSVREIIEELPSLTSEELRKLREKIESMTGDGGRNLHAERVDGRLVLVGTEPVTQADVEAILSELP